MVSKFNKHSCQTPSWETMQIKCHNNHHRVQHAHKECHCDKLHRSHDQQITTIRSLTNSNRLCILCGSQCVKQTLRVSYLPLNLGGGWGRLRAAAAGGLAAQQSFFSYLVAISFPKEFDVWGRLCTHFEAAKVRTFATVTQHFSVSTAASNIVPEGYHLFRPWRH
jgi:hypothetical protein